ncbi:snRNA-activating protein complex subunit 2 isoform X2 [Tachyglossus aculeatus]|uniref:snRNA-activating protein complex subunit 2 isoform X2 n=1 Tax=Tachyglossus aculeatus TaxID=9261 RepID=UPI0018F6C978|nr:snRNA-activating protein complex subunit 2 isoform X2 [Tachyglossus aculeatus]
MKPPARRRAAPARYAGAAKEARGARPPWNAHEKQRLLRALRARGGERRREPSARELTGCLPRRTEAEISRFVHGLKGQVAREVIRDEHRRCREEQKLWEAQIPAPIEVLTIAATEPVGLRHSIPRKTTQVTERQILRGIPARNWEPPSSVAFHPARESPEGRVVNGVQVILTTAPAVAGNFTVDFEKVYRYLFILARGGRKPELTPSESAVLLDLLMSLPEELSHLNCGGLESHMCQAYRDLVSPQKGQPETAGPAPCPLGTGHWAEDHGSGSLDGGLVPGASGFFSHRNSCSTALAPPTELGPWAPQSAWQEVDFCPLNSFLIPLRLLTQSGDPGW